MLILKVLNCARVREYRQAKCNYFETESQGVRGMMDAVKMRSRHIIPVPTDQIVKVAASHLSLSLSISRPSLPFTLSQSLAVNPMGGILLCNPKS